MRVGAHQGMFYLLTLSIAGVAIITMIVILLRHLKELRLLNPESITEERERRKLNTLLLQRFTRVKFEKLAPLKALLHRAMYECKKTYHEIYLKLLQLEKFYKQAKAPFAIMAPSVKDRIKLLLNEARSLARDLKWADAERRFLEILAIDPRNTDAYQGLGMIYLKQKLYPQARETFEFLVKIKKADDACYAALADIAEAEGNASAAEEMRLKAVELRPRLPNRHAELAQLYLAHSQFQKAWTHAKRSTELDPKSAKYLELSLDVAILLGDRQEAKRRYDKLRLLSDDQPRLQALKERIDRMAVV